MKIIQFAGNSTALTRLLDESCRLAEQRGTDYVRDLAKARAQCDAPRGVLLEGNDLGNEQIRIRLHYEINKGLRR